MPLKIDIEELRERYTKSYVRGLKSMFRGRETILEEILKIGTGNSQGPLWIAGGGVYRPPIGEESGVKRATDSEGKEIIDVDIVVSQLSQKPYSPKVHGWSEWRTRFGNTSFRKNGYNVVIMDLSSFPTLAARNLKPTIENFLTTTPLNIQSIAVPIGDDPYETRLIGDIGILAIYKREVKINDLREGVDRALREWRYEAQNQNIDLEEFERYIIGINLNPLVIESVKRKAEELGFGYDLTLPLEENPGQAS